MLSVLQVAKELGTDRSTVLRLIHAGKLKAVNISPADKRPYWRVSDEVLAQFKEGVLSQTSHKK